MDDPETRAAVERIQERNLWGAGWCLCAAATFTSIVYLLVDWHNRDLLGKVMAVFLVIYLLLWPTFVAVGRMRGRRISPASLFMGAYALLSLAVLTFGFLSHPI
jgi:hypothetical protein